MVIRDSQITDLQVVAQNSFERRALDYFKSQDSEADESVLVPAIRAHTEEAFQFAIENENDVIRFIELRMSLGDKKWSSPAYEWVQEYLLEWSSAALRLDHVMERLRFNGESVE